MASFRLPTESEFENLYHLALLRMEPALELMPTMTDGQLIALNRHGDAFGHAYHASGAYAFGCHALRDPGAFWPLGMVYAMERGDRSRDTFRRARRLGIEWIKVGKGAYYRCR